MFDVSHYPLACGATTGDIGIYKASWAVVNDPIFIDHTRVCTPCREKWGNLPERHGPPVQGDECGT